MFVQSACELKEVVEPYVSFPAFDPTNIRWMQIGTLGQALLRQAPCEPELADSLSESIPVCLTHVRTDHEIKTMSPETMSSVLRTYISHIEKACRVTTV